MVIKRECSYCKHKTHLTKRKLWSKEEDEKLIAYIKEYGEGQWRHVPEKAGIDRCGKSCRSRWLASLRPNTKCDDFTAEEAKLISILHTNFGNKWCEIAKSLPGRTDEDIGSYWKIKSTIRKLVNSGIEPASSCNDDDEEEVFYLHGTKNLLGGFLEINERVAQNDLDGEISAELNLDLTIGPSI